MVGTILLILTLIVTTVFNYIQVSGKKAKQIDRLKTKNRKLRAEINNLLESDKFVFVKLTEGVKTDIKDIRLIKAKLKPFINEGYKVIVTYDELSLRK